MSCCCAVRRETVVADIEFNRSAVGINAKKDWEDADFFGQIGAQMSSATPEGLRCRYLRTFGGLVGPGWVELK